MKGVSGADWLKTPQANRHYGIEKGVLSNIKPISAQIRTPSLPVRPQKMALSRQTRGYQQRNTFVILARSGSSLLK
jgi:hypothetical protein